MSGRITLDNGATPANPPSGSVTLYNDTAQGLTVVDEFGSVDKIALGTITPPVFGGVPGNISPTIPAGAVLTEYGNGNLAHSSFQLTNVVVPLVNDPGLGAFCSIPLYIPGDGIIELMCVTSLLITPDAAGVSNTWSGAMILGTSVVNTSAAFAAQNTYYTELAIGPAVAGSINPHYCSSPNVIGGFNQGSPFSVNDFSLTVKPSTQLVLKFKVDAADETVNIIPTNLIVDGRLDLYWRNLFYY